MLLVSSRLISHPSQFSMREWLQTFKKIIHQKAKVKQKYTKQKNFIPDYHKHAQKSQDIHPAFCPDKTEDNSPH